MKPIELDCPVCRAHMVVDRETGAVLTHEAAKAPKPVSDIVEAAQALKKDPERRETLFQKSVESEKSKSDRLKKSFEEMLKKTKEDPDAAPPVRDMDLD